jgi:hypothetical protein
VRGQCSEALAQYDHDNFSLTFLEEDFVLRTKLLGLHKTIAAIEVSVGPGARRSSQAPLEALLQQANSLQVDIWHHDQEMYDGCLSSLWCALERFDELTPRAIV